MTRNWDSRAQEWDNGCKVDSTRNALVIPHLNNLLETSKVQTVIDVGCATGYITRQLAALHLGEQIEWILLDDNAEMLQFAEERSGSLMSVRTIKANLANSEQMRSVPPADLAFIVFTTLELQITSQVAENIAIIVKGGGTLVVFLPDILRDVLRSESKTQGLIHQYTNGYCELDKLDKFTRRPYPFHATRIEFMIAELLAAGFNMTRFVVFNRGTPSEQDVIFGLDFKRVEAKA